MINLEKISDTKSEGQMWLYAFWNFVFKLHNTLTYLSKKDLNKMQLLMKLYSSS